VTARPIFVVLDGIDGCGKSTQAVRLRRRLEGLGRRVLHVREPGSTALGERLREALLDPALGEVVPIAEVFLYQAARAQLVHEAIRPALAEGRDVVCERWHYATAAYQGVGGGAGLEAVRVTSALATEGTEPDRAILLDVPDRLAGERLGALLDRIEQRGDAYRSRVAEAFRLVFAREPGRLRIVGAVGPPAEVEARIWEAVRDLV